MLKNVNQKVQMSNRNIMNRGPGYGGKVIEKKQIEREMPSAWKGFRRDRMEVKSESMPDEKAVQLFRRQVSSSGIFKTLKNRRENPSVKSRRRAKILKANYRRQRMMRAK